MSRGRSGHENNNIGEAGHESSNTFQPTLAPSMFQGSSRNHFEGGLFNNAGGNIRELLLVYAKHLLTTIIGTNYK